ncbi:MAG: 4Fe-4S binding protein [Methanomethylovorans sp.]|uniref:4Fe-4S binding protein n=1 Tax=Methanomethylovorans sp. TaxID=2758717 RepID=UPI000B1D3A2B|nr:4Fe-4S binding protein [Methanomethylovorans sp.]
MEISKRCVGCGQCAAFCPKEAIIVKGIAFITADCIQCRICMAYCPMKAIEESV